MPRVLFAFLLCVVACDGGSSSTGSPTGPAAPMASDLEGTWRGSSQLTSVIGGECVRPIFLALVGLSAAQNLVLMQSGSRLMATATSRAGSPPWMVSR